MADTIVCPHCEAEIAGDSTFCKACSEQLRAGEQADTDCCESVPLCLAVSGLTAAEDPVVWHHH